MKTIPSIDDLAQRYFDYIYRRDLASDRWKNLSETEKRDITERELASCRRTIDGLLTIIESRDPDMLARKLHKDNKFFLSAFHEVTGIRLGTTDKAIKAALRDYCGHEKWDTHFHFAAETIARQHAESEAKAEARRREIALAERYTWRLEPSSGIAGKQSGTAKEFIDWAIESGYHPLETKRGVIGTVTLSKPLPGNRWSAGYVLVQKQQKEYARERFAQRTTSTQLHSQESSCS